MFITLYGINNIGKSTQAKLLVERLNQDGKKAVYLKYPVYEIEPSGTFLNKYLRNQSDEKISEDQLQMWFALNRYQFEAQLKSYLDQEFIVIAEDYTGTGIAWGMAKGLEREWLENLNSKLLKEDFAILIDGERFKEAEEEAHIHENDENLMQKSREAHLKLAELYSWEKVEVIKGIQEMNDYLYNLIRSIMTPPL